MFEIVCSMNILRMSVVNIDGSVLEGGGQILRISMSFSALLQKPIRVFNIRAKRNVPGLRNQHLTGLELIRDICGGQLDGAQVGSCEIQFKPGSLQSGNYEADAKTAGSVGLLLQISLPCLLFVRNPSLLTLKGGTNAEFAPQIDYLAEVFKNQSKRFGVNFTCDIVRRGYYPKGGGIVKSVIEAVDHLNGVKLLDRGDVMKITGKSYVAGNLPIKVAHEMADSARNQLRQRFPDVSMKINCVKETSENAIGTGCGIVLIAETSNGCQLAGSAIGKKGKPNSKVGSDAANELLDNLMHGGCVDNFLQDQFIILMALAKGKSSIKTGPITLHTQTAIHISETMTQVRFKITENDNGTCVIDCEGMGYESDNTTL